jgi:nucleoid-associated protein YgaU
VLDVAGATDRDGGGQRWYTVMAGDTLYGIAARLLGDPSQWLAIAELNGGWPGLARSRMRRAGPLIWPGLRPQLADQARGRAAWREQPGSG